MYLSVNTVKTHFKSIFRKLGATRRGEAVRRAKKLGLIYRTEGASRSRRGTPPRRVMPARPGPPIIPSDGPASH